MTDRVAGRVKCVRWAIRAMLGCACCAAASISLAEQVPSDLGFFGIGSCAANSRNHSLWIPQMAEIGIKNLRAFGGGWGGVEPQRGEWNFSTLDGRYQYLMSKGIQPGITLEGWPKWSKGNEPGALPVPKLDEWAGYAGKMAEHFKGKVRHYEILNEPPNGTKNAPPSDCSKLVVAAYDAIKKADPDAMVGLATKSANVNYLDRVIRAGAKGHYDYVTLHPYESLGTIMQHPGTEQVFMRIAPTVRKMLAQLDPEKTNVPIWFTEIGFDSKRGEDKQAQAIVKAYTMGAAQGITTIEWFEGMDGDSGPMGILRGDRSPRPAYKALGELMRLLGPKPRALGWLLLNDKHYAFVFEGAKGTVMATWTSTTAPDLIKFPAAVKIVDPATGKVTESDSCQLTLAPVLVDGVPEAMVRTAQANKDRPFPWGGDYSSATSVSVEMGKTNVEKGLHTMSAETVAADVIAYGGNARTGDVPGGNVFIVDANFLSYTAVPIEITAVVRRNAENAPARITLDYEAAEGATLDGYKKAQPFDIPDNQQWHEAKWRIDDAQFVGSWGYNFRFNSGKYLVQRVTVTKLAK